MAFVNVGTGGLELWVTDVASGEPRRVTGPELNATLLPAGLVDELHLVYAPKLAGGPDPLTILSGPPLDPAIDLELLSLHDSGGYLFARYALRGPAD